jgi:hypothetical protein
MDPYQQYQGSSSGSPYEFIMSPNQKPKKRFGFGNGNFAFTIGLIVSGALLFMIIITIVLNMFGGSKVGTADLVTVTQAQNEISRIADQGARTGTQQVTKNLAITIQYTMDTQQKNILNFLAENGTTIDPKDLKLKQNASTDQQLTSAKTTSTFDLVFSQIMQNELTTYANDLKQLHARASSTTEKDMMSSYYEQTQLLISQIPYTQDTIESAGQ